MHETHDNTLSFTTGYMDDAVFNLEKTRDLCVEKLTPHLDDFDTIVGTGFSGGLVIPALALRLGKKFLLIRKETDDSHHGSGRLLGELGEKWIFVDDFTQTGRTRNRVFDKIEKAVLTSWRYRDGFRSRHVGDFYYASREPEFEPRVPLTPEQEFVIEFQDELANSLMDALEEEEERSYRDRIRELNAQRRSAEIRPPAEVYDFNFGGWSSFTPEPYSVKEVDRELETIREERDRLMNTLLENAKRTAPLDPNVVPMSKARRTYR